MSSELTKEDIFRMFAETDKMIKELATLFTGQWGKLIDSTISVSFFSYPNAHIWLSLI